MNQVMNSPKYLAIIFTKIRSAALSGSNMAGQSLKDVVLVDKDDSGELGGKPDDLIMVIVTYARQSVNEILSSPNLDDEDKAVLLRKIDRVSDFVMGCMSGQNWQNIKNVYLKQDFIDELHMVSASLKSAGNKSALNRDFAKDSIPSLKQILEQVRSSTIPPYLKASIISEILALIFIFETFDAYGPRDAEARVKSMVADIAFHREDLSEDDALNLANLFKFLGGAMSKFKFGVDVLKAGEHMVKLIKKEE